MKTPDSPDDLSNSGVANESDLLARHAPVLRFDSRELFFPTSVDDYIGASSLVVDGETVLDQGSVDEVQLDHRLPLQSHLQFVSEFDRGAVVRGEAQRLARKLFGPRLGRVGLFGRILDALFLLSVFIRPTTPRLTTAAVAIKAEKLRLHEEPVVYGRALHVGSWLVLHYAYFYAMNDWRSGYRGLNDHEADWEQAWVMCDPKDAQPVWVVCSSHDHTGVNLRRHWDDPECRRDGQRPVLFVGAGSHAMYFRPGDYVTRIDVPGLRWLLRLQRWVRQALRITDQAADRGLGPALGMPFIDAATGDGREVSEWTIEALDNDRNCFGQFRGLWGFDSGDPLDGERGPSGPKFDRTGEIRMSWADPVGFAGLHGTGPPSRAPAELKLSKISGTMEALESEIDRASQLLPLVQKTETSGEMTEESERLSELRRQLVELRDLRTRIQRGDTVSGDLRAHLDKPAIPLAPPQEAGRILALWAALSVPLLLLSVAALLVFDGLAIGTLLLATAAGFSIFEQLVRRHFQAVLRLILIYVVLALSFVLAGAFFWGALSVSIWAIGGVITTAAILLFVANLGELTAVQRRAEAAASDEVGDDPDRRETDFDAESASDPELDETETA